MKALPPDESDPLQAFDRLTRQARSEAPPRVDVRARVREALLREEPFGGDWTDVLARWAIARWALPCGLGLAATAIAGAILAHGMLNRLSVEVLWLQIAQSALGAPTG